MRWAFSEEGLCLTLLKVKEIKREKLIGLRKWELARPNVKNIQV